MDQRKTNRELWTEHREMLRAQFIYFEKNVSFGHRIAAIPGVTLYDLMVSEAMLNSEAVEVAIEHFLATKAWPKVEGEVAVYIYHRFFVGLMAMDALLGLRPAQTIEDKAQLEAFHKQFGSEPVIMDEPSGDAPVTFRPPAPDPRDDREFFRWLLIALWKPLGPVWLHLFADKRTERSTFRPAAE